MSNTKNIQDAVETLCESAGVRVLFSLVGETARDKWVCDEWRVVMEKRKPNYHGKADHVERFEYFTGTGHRKPNKNSWDRTPVPVAPHMAGVLHSLILESSACEESFNEWCDNYGCDTDSRKALETYLACQANAAKLQKIFTRAQIEELREILSEY